VLDPVYRTHPALAEDAGNTVVKPLARHHF
jgi:hypothetical protein